MAYGVDINERNSTGQTIEEFANNYGVVGNRWVKRAILNCHRIRETINALPSDFHTDLIPLVLAYAGFMQGPENYFRPEEEEAKSGFWVRVKKCFLDAWSWIGPSSRSDFSNRDLAKRTMSHLD